MAKEPINYGAFASNPFGQMGRKLSFYSFSYSVTSVTNEELFSGGTKWVFIIEVLSTYENVGSLAAELGRVDPERFGNLSISTARYIGFDPKAGTDGKTVPFGKLEFGLTVYDDSKLWVERGAPPTTIEGLLGFPESGDNLTLDEIVGLLMYQSYQYQPYIPLSIEAPRESVRLKIPKPPTIEIPKPATIKNELELIPPPKEKPPPKKRHIRRLSDVSDGEKVPPTPRRVVRRIESNDDDR